MRFESSLNLFIKSLEELEILLASLKKKSLIVSHDQSKLLGNYYGIYHVYFLHRSLKKITEPGKNQAEEMFKRKMCHCVSGTQ